MNKKHNFATDNRDGYIVPENVPETNVRKINGRTHDEIKKGMTCCLTRWEVDHLTSCHTDCPYQSEGIWCRNVLMADIKAWNKQLESRLAQVERERDALMNDLLIADKVDCVCCVHNKATDSCDCECDTCAAPCACFRCENNSLYEWRGVCEGENI